MNWISIKDRLPDKTTEQVIVYVVGDQRKYDLQNIFFANFIVHDNDGFCCDSGVCGWNVWSQLEDKYRIVTHWMPLPDKPKETE